MPSIRINRLSGSKCPGGEAVRRGPGFRGFATATVLGVLAATAHAGAPVFATLLGGSGQDYALAVTSDAQGNTYVAGLTYSPDFPVTPGAMQTTFGQTSDAFIAKLGPDGKKIWATYLGGILDDYATAIALDGAGNVWVAGYTRSPNFPLVNAIEPTYNEGVTDDYDAFVAKIDPTGGKLLFSTFLGGNLDDGAAGMATDAAGNAYVAVNTNATTGFPGVQEQSNTPGIVVTKLAPAGTLVSSYFHPTGSASAIALDAAGNIYIAGSATTGFATTPGKMFGPPGTSFALVFKISPDGSQKFFETGLGGSVRASASSLAVNSAGEVFLGGSTTSVDFPLAHPLQTTPGARPLWKSTDGGSTYTPLDDLPFALPQSTVADPTTPTTVYQATGDMGVLKSVDGGATWTQASTGITGASVLSLVMDPVHSQTLYATTQTAVYKSTNGAQSWMLIDTRANPGQILVDPQNPNILYEVNANIRKSTDGGATWSAVTFPGQVVSLALDPRVSGHLFAVSAMVFCGFFCSGNQVGYLYRSVDGGATWIQIQPSTGSGVLSVDGSTNPSTVFEGFTVKSVDGGITWQTVTSPFGNAGTGPILGDGAGNLYVAVSPGGVFVSHDHGVTWTPVGYPGGPSIPANNVVSASIALAGSSGTIYATVSLTASSGFVSKLSADGGTLEFSTYLRSHASLHTFPDFSAEDNAMLQQSWISGIGLDPAGNIVVGGGTRGNDLPTVNPAQATSGGMADAFAAAIAADFSKLNYSTYFGGSQDDGALAVAVDGQGNAIIAGQTWSGDLQIPGGIQPPTGFGEAFVVKLSTAGPVITSVVNGASFQAGVAAGSWVTIRGTNLANTNPGRKWMDADFVNGTLPTSLDGVSVTFDGKPAYVEFVSPTQINVLAPTDGAVGTVTVSVNNNGAVSANATATLQAVAPAFFLDGATNFAAATRLPDYALIADPVAVAGAVAAKPGDLVVLWGTGFGATNPAAPANVPVSGAPAVVQTTTVTVGGMQVPVISAVLTTGTAGLYQITVQLPANVPTGTVPVQASIGGTSTPAGTMLFVGTP
jgi:uncharacterized protein (TIGR03437 family)